MKLYTLYIICNFIYFKYLFLNKNNNNNNNNDDNNDKKKLLLQNLSFMNLIFFITSIIYVDSIFIYMYIIIFKF